MSNKITQQLVIQLIGPARSGKDFTASSLKTYYESNGYSVDITSYASAIKYIASTLLGISLTDLDRYKNHSERFELHLFDTVNASSRSVGNVRTLLQKLGNEAIKPLLGESVWADIMQTFIDKSTADIIIIPDCRFFVELNQISGITVRVYNPTVPIMQHASETELSDFTADFLLDNTNYTATQTHIADLAKDCLRGNT